MSILANSTPAATALLDREYMCKRCGIVKTRGGGNPKAEYCVDCIPEAARFGWIPTPKTWDGKKK